VRLPLWIAARYLRTGRKSGFITLLTGISVGGVAVGVTALLTVLAVMNGFENEVQSRIAGTDAHVLLLGESAAGVSDAATVAAVVARQPGVEGVAPFTYAKALVFHEGLTEGLIVKGVDLRAERGVTTVGLNIQPQLDSIPVRGADGLPAIVLGGELASRLAARVGDRVVLAYITESGASALGFTPRLREFRLAGIFKSGLYTYDSSLGFTSIPASQEFFQLGEAVTGLEVRITDMFAAERVARKLLEAVPGRGLRANNWIELNYNLFRWIKFEKMAMFVILTLIVLVAAFNIVSTLFMVVMEKRRDIGVLRSLGARRRTILQVFLAEGLFIGGLGTGIGLVLGSALIAFLRWCPLFELPGEVYFIERLPVRPEAGDFAAVVAAALVLCLAAGLYPAWRASLLDPVEAIRRQG
jgi:lipoprotein-releasing system permease protein